MTPRAATRPSVRFFPDDWLNPIPLDRLFARSAPFEIDIGCGKGRFLLSRAARHPETNFLGIDRMLRRLRKVDAKVAKKALANVRLMRVDAYYATAHLLPADAVDVFYIMFPDPWPKKRHVDHRLFDPDFVEALHRTLKAGGVFHLATDHLPYFESVRDLMRRDIRFEETAPFIPEEHERTDFELMFLGIKTIGRCSFRKP